MNDMYMPIYPACEYDVNPPWITTFKILWQI